MGKSQQNQSQDMAKQNYNKANAQGDEMRGQLQSDLLGAKQTAADTYSAASSGYKSFMGGTGAYNPDEYKKIQNQNDSNISTGGYNPEALSKVRGDISSNVKTGGYSPEELSQLEAGGLGGINAEQAQNIRGAYNGLIANGGISDETAGAMRRQAAGSTQSVYATLGQNLARQNSIAGTGGAGGETAEMARQAGNSAATATTGANAQIGQLRQQGTIAGVGGLSQFEQGAAAGQRQVAGEAATNRVASTGQESELATHQAQGTLQASQAQQDLASNAATQRIQAAGGLVNLYNSSPGYVNSLVQQIMQQQSVSGTLTTQQSQIMAELSKNPGLFDNIMKGISAIGGAAGGVMTGIGALP